MADPQRVFNSVFFSGIATFVVVAFVLGMALWIMSW